MKHNENGFGLVGVIVVVVVASIVGFAGFSVISADNEVQNTFETTETVTVPKPEEKVVENQDDTKSTVITTGDSEFGTMLFDGNGQAIYIWELEETSEAECYDDCAEAWPPVFTDGAPTAKGDVNSALLGTTQRRDGTTQVTYNGHPLYYYVDEEPGEVKCHNIPTHGGLWWVIKPDGVRAD